MISKLIIDLVKKHFDESSYSIDMNSRPFLVFKPVCIEFGTIKVFDDGDEILVYVGNFTHAHFSNYERELTTDQKESEIAESVMEFLKDMFNDKVACWKGANSGGFYYLDELEPESGTTHQIYTWSGPCSSKAVRE